MKNFRIFSRAFIIALTGAAFYACTGETSEVVKSDRESTLAERFATCKKIANFHSEGLKYVLEELKAMSKYELEASLKSKDEEVRNNFISNLMNDFVCQQEVSAQLSKLDSKITFAFAGNQQRNEGQDATVHKKDADIDRALVFF